MTLESRLREVSLKFAPGDEDLAGHITKILRFILGVSNKLPCCIKDELKGYVQYAAMDVPSVPYIPAVHFRHAQFVEDCVTELVSAGLLVRKAESISLANPNLTPKLRAEQTLLANIEFPHVELESEQAEHPATLDESDIRDIQEFNMGLVDTISVRPSFCHNIFALNELWSRGAIRISGAALYTGCYALGTLRGMPIVTDYIGERHDAKLRLKLRNAPDYVSPQDQEFIVSGFLSLDDFGPLIEVVSVVIQRPLPLDFLRIIQKYRTCV